MPVLKMPVFWPSSLIPGDSLLLIGAIIFSFGFQPISLQLHDRQVEFAACLRADKFGSSMLLCPALSLSPSPIFKILIGNHRHFLNLSAELRSGAIHKNEKHTDMPSCQLHPLDESANDQMLSLIKNSPMSAGGLELYFDKSPDVFRFSKLKFDQSIHAGLYSDAELKGMAAVGFYDALVQGRQERVFTFYNLYLKKEMRGQHLPEFIMRELFPKVKELADFGIATTLRGNRPVENIVERRYDEGMSQIRIVDTLDLKSILFSLPKRNETGLLVRNANWEDAAEIVRLLKEEHCQRDFGLVFCEDSFPLALKNRNLDISDYYVAADKSGRLKGVCLAWDCGDFRRPVILKFGPKFYPTLTAYRLLEKILPLTPFPKKGDYFRELTITDYAVEGRDPQIMHALLCEIYRRHHNKQYHFMNFGSCGSDNLLKAVKGFWHRNIISHIIFTSTDPARFDIPVKMPYIDIALL